MYAYTSNNPVMRVDPSGYAWYHWAIAGAVVVGLGIAVVAPAGGALPAVVALTAVANGAAAATTAATITSAAFIGASTALAGAGLIAAGNSIGGNRFDADKFADQGEAALFATISGGFEGLLNGISMSSVKKNPLANIKYTDKVKAQATGDDFHGFSEHVDAFGPYGNVYTKPGGDGQVRTWVEIPGSYKGYNGVFQYIIDYNGYCNHRLFVPYK